MIARLFAKHFQISYVVRDAERVMAHLGERHGVARWHQLELQPEWPVSMIALAYIDDMMIELIQAHPERPSLYTGWEPEAADGMRLHHLGFYAKSDAEWNSATEQLAANGYPVVITESFPDVLDYQYSDTTAVFGHYYELVRLRAQGEAIFASIPRN
jgi:hypothetical protein